MKRTIVVRHGSRPLVGASAPQEQTVLGFPLPTAAALTALLWLFALSLPGRR